MKTLTRSFQVGTFIFNLQSNERKYNNKYNGDKEDGVTKPFSRAFDKKLDQGPGHGEIFPV